jgi:beta-carotene 15,15'-dioxygenase
MAVPASHAGFSPPNEGLPSKLRLGAVPVLTFILILIDHNSALLGGQTSTVIAAVAILLAGIPHGTLDVEIAARRFGKSGILPKLQIILTYLSCAAAMAALWSLAPSAALTIFLIVSIVHFSGDWRIGLDSFFAVMVGWALIALPALSHPMAVTAVFESLTGDSGGATVAAILACTSVPAALGSAVFAALSFRRGDFLNGLDVLACLVAALALPPLVAFGIFFCGLHSPRHMMEALRQVGHISASQKALVISAVIGLSLGIGILLFISAGAALPESGIVRTAFVLLSILTVPHFILEQLLDKQSAGAGIQ